jgi:tetratricopeptide (TPR) repeat protein
MLKPVTIGVLATILMLPSWAMADNEGQEKLDEATSLKLEAKDPQQLGKVIELCEKAKELGLDEDNTAIANQVLAASALQRAKMTVQQLPKAGANAAAFNRLRSTAQRDLDKALKASPNLVEALLLKTRLEALPGGNRDKALANIEKAIELLADKPEERSNAYILRAGLQEQLEDRLADLQKAIDTDSSNSDAWQARIIILLQAGRFEDVINDASKVLEKDQSNLVALDASIEAFFRLKKFEEAIKLLTRHIEKDPKAGPAYRARARAHLALSKSDEAMQDVNKALEIDPKDAEALILRSQLYLVAGELEKSSQDVNEALKIRPEAVEAVYTRARLAMQEGRFAEAISDYQLIVRVNPDNVPLITDLANLYQADKRPRLAIQLLDALLKQHPKEWRAFRVRGDARLSINDHAGAINDYQKALDLIESEEDKTDTDYSGLLNNLAWVLSTSPQDAVRDGKRALDLGLKACEATEYKQAHILSTLAACYAETGDFENARKWSGKAVELGAEEDHEQLEQLKKELESYKENKAWREEQHTEENQKPLNAAGEAIET